jgi:ribosomal protein S18 acetylase RimI-like enzyme
MTDSMGNMIPLNKIQQLRMVDGLANHPSSFVLFLILEEEVVGLAACFINFSTFHARPYLNIHDIIVDNKHRGKGYGKMLMSELIVLSEQRKYCKITLEVREDNVIAQKLYTHMGFEESNPKMLFWTKKL